MLSVALSLGSRRAGVTRRHVSMEPGLSSEAGLPQQQRLPDRLTARGIGEMTSVYQLIVHTRARFDAAPLGRTLAPEEDVRDAVTSIGDCGARGRARR